MSETEKTEITEEQVPADVNSSAISRDSQDFQLVDMEGLDDDLSNTSALLLGKNGKDLPISVADSTNTQVCSNVTQGKGSERLKDDVLEKEILSKEQDVLNVSENNSDEKELNTDDEDEILGTPPEMHSPSKNKTSVNVELIASKRKAAADVTEVTESAKKILKTLLHEDAKTLQERKTEEEDDETNLSDSPYSDVTRNRNQDNVIIEETQEPETQEVSVHDEGIKKRNTTCDVQEYETVEAQFKQVEQLDKDENLNNSKKLAEGILIKDTNDKNSLLETDHKENSLTVVKGNPFTDVKDDVNPSVAKKDTEKFSLDTDDKGKSLNAVTDVKNSSVNLAVKENLENTTKDGKIPLHIEEDKTSTQINVGDKDVESTISTKSKDNTLGAPGEKKISLIYTQDVVTDAIDNKELSNNNAKEKSDKTIVLDQESTLDKNEAHVDSTQIENKESVNDEILKEDRNSTLLKSDAGSKNKVELTDSNKTVSPNKEKNVQCTPKLSTNANKSRMSIEVIFDRSVSQGSKSHPTELVEIDEDGEKIVLDSSQDDSVLKVTDNSTSDSTKVDGVYNNSSENKSSSDTTYKSTESTKESTIVNVDSKITSESSELKTMDTDTTISMDSDLTSNEPLHSGSSHTHVKEKDVSNISCPKDMDNVEPLLSVSENEPNLSSKEENTKNNIFTQSGSLAKTVQIEREVGIFVKLKCLLQIDENSKEFLNKELVAVNCESVIEAANRPKANDTSASLADISGNDNKDSSPGSVNSNPQLFHLNPSRLSIMSSVSSSSSASSAASLATKLMLKDTHFSLPRAPAKHAKKSTQDAQQTGNKQDELYERLTKEWKNSQLLTTNILNFLNGEIANPDIHNASSEHLDDQLQKILSSTPETRPDTHIKSTPKSTRRGKAMKRPFLKENSLMSTPVKNKESGVTNDDEEEPKSSKKMKMEKPNEVSEENSSDDLIGKEVFAKWSDNNYYPGKVVDKVKTKYKVNFYDGHSKLLIEGFIIQIPKTLEKGLSVYATTIQDDYGSSGIITDVQEMDDGTFYTVEIDDKGEFRVQIRDIFLSPDQAQVFKEMIDSETKSLPSTPKHLSQVTLENMVDGKRRSTRRVTTPGFSTPRSRKRKDNSNGKSINPEQPSSSGVTPKARKTEDRVSNKSEDQSSDSGFSVKEETLNGVQPEVIGTPNEQNIKGMQRKIKGKARSKKRSEDEETIAKFGPIPDQNPTLFAGMSFLLTCASLENIDRYRADNKESNSDPGTENEEEWVRIPFVRDRLMAQISAGGGKIYEDFSLIPEEEYENTKLITNVPNNTAKSILCLSMGIPAYNHNWIIRCCQENKIVNPAEEELPAGWSLEKQLYVEKFQRSSKKPLTNMIVILPNVPSSTDFIAFWRQVCENAGAVIVLVDNAESMEGFVEHTVVVTNHRCPSWVVEKAYNLQIPLLSTTWVVQCLIEGKVCSYDTHPRYKYNYVQ